MPPISQEIRQHIIDVYNNDHAINFTQLSKNIHVSRVTIRKILRKAGLRQIYKKDIDHSNALNIKFFDKIDNEVKAYFLVMGTAL